LTHDGRPGGSWLSTASTIVVKGFLLLGKSLHVEWKMKSFESTDAMSWEESTADSVVFILWEALVP
jgi:hypothetical protein